MMLRTTLAGFALALACDTRIASDSAFFACAYGRIGASPDGGMTYFLPRVVGLHRAKALARAGTPVCINVHIARSEFRKGSISM